MRATTNVIRATITAAFVFCVAAGAAAQTAAPRQTQTSQKSPSSPARPFVVIPSQSLSDLERRLHPDNKTEEIIGGEGMQLRVAVQHEKDVVPAVGELHDGSDDVYYVLEGTATLTLGGKLEAPHEIQPGEWRGARIIGGRNVDIAKGDLVIVPRGTPHQRSTAGKDFSMILIKIFAEPLPPAKPKPNSDGKGQKP